MKNKKTFVFKLLLKYTKRLWPSFVLLAVLMGGSILLQLLSPQVIRFFIDSALAQKPLKILILSIAAFAGASMAQQLFSVLSTYLCQNIGWSATNALRKDLILHYMNLDMEFHKDRSSGEMIERLDGDVNDLFDFFSTLILKIISNLLIILGTVVVFLRENWLISLCLFLSAALSIAILRKVQGIGTKHWVRSAEARAMFYGFIKEQLDNVKDTRSSGAKQNALFKFLTAVKTLYKETIKANLVYPLLWCTSTMIFAVGTALSLGLGVYLWSQGVITIGTIYLIYSYTDLMSMPIMQLRDNLGKLQQAEASVLRIEEIFTMQSKLTRGSSYLGDGGPLALEIRDLSFGYENTHRVLHDISFKLEPGKTLGIVGRTGSGKTTLVKLIARLYDPEKGEILLNGKNMKNIKDESLRRHIAYLTQEVQLFHGTVRDNITLFDKSIGDNQIHQAIAELGLREWLEKLPKGLDTELSFAENSFSSGETQLLSLIRVFLKNPSLIILDEASSKLDPVTERQVTNALKAVTSGKSCIIIAHKLSTLNHADHILILQEGKIAEHGPRKKLLCDEGSLYMKLLRKGIEEVLA